MTHFDQVESQKKLNVLFAERNASIETRAAPLGSVPNGDRKKLNHFAALHTKCFAHDPSTGHVDANAYQKFLDALEQGDTDALSKIPLGTDITRYSHALRLVNPSAVFNLELYGRNKMTWELRPFVGIDTAAFAAHLDELYGMARMRDIPFFTWQQSPLPQQHHSSLVSTTSTGSATSLPEGDSQKRIRSVCRTLSLWPVDGTSCTQWPVNDPGHHVTPDVLFRGVSRGDLRGPYVSQFLLQPYVEGLTRRQQRYTCLAPKSDYLVDWKEFLKCQNGQLPSGFQKPLLDPESRYIFSLRAGASLVKADPPTQIAHIALLVLQTLGVPTQIHTQLTGSEQGFVTLGFPDVWETIGRVTKLALDACWYHKYVHLTLRPEEAGFQLVQMLRKQSPWPVDARLPKSRNVEWAIQKYGSALLPQAYPEGAPCHPSYPSGHAAVIGACVTILKAWYVGSTPFQTVYQASADGKHLVECSVESPLTVEDELDKLATNVSFFRNAAGLHYRSDAERGIRLGEEVALVHLEDLLARYPQPITLTLRKRSGRMVSLSNIDPSSSSSAAEDQAVPTARSEVQSCDNREVQRALKQ